MRPPRQKGAAQRLNDIIDAHRCIKSKYLDRERELQETKWYPYRFISAYHATMIFVREYERYYTRAFAEHFDKRKHVLPVNRLELHKPSRLMTQAWIGRQKADALGMPYNIYLQFFGAFLMRRTRKQLPRMNQIEGSDNAKAIWPQQLDSFWEQHAWHQLMVINASQLHNDNFKNLPAQIAFRSWIMEVVKVSGRTYRQALEAVCFRKCLLPPSSFRPLMDEEVYTGHVQTLEADLQHRRLEPEVVQKAETVDFLPSCFGLLGVSLDEAQPCSSCVFAQSCRIFHAEASNRMRNDQDFLTADDLKRKFDRERQAEHRKKKKNAAA